MVDPDQLDEELRKLVSAGVILNPIKLQHLLTAVQSSIYLDDRLNPTDLARQMENLSADNIVGKTIPTDGFGTAADGASIVKVSPAEVKTFVNRLIGTGDTKLGSAATAGRSTTGSGRRRAHGPPARPPPAAARHARPHGSGRAARPPSPPGATACRRGPSP